jgi:hypothetical protein
MNKLERRLKQEAKYKKRLKNHGITTEIINNITRRTGKKPNFYCYKTTGNPCSCANCSPGKIQEKAKYRLNKFNKNEF